MWDVALIAGFVLAIIGLLWFIARELKAQGKTEEKLDEAERAIEEAGDAAAIKRTVDAATPDERERLRKRWGG